MLKLPYQIRNLPHRMRGFRAELLRLSKVGFIGTLRGVYIPGDGNGAQTDLGVLSRRVVTDIGAQFVVDALQNLVEMETINYHQSGTDNTAEDVSDTDLGTAVGSRTAGTQSEPSSTVYQSQATINYTSTLTITEHGIFWASSGASTLFDRSVFTGVPVNNGDSIQFTYQLTVNSGG
jgi:hypothetical protein